MYSIFLEYFVFCSKLRILYATLDYGAYFSKLFIGCVKIDNS